MRTRLDEGPHSRHFAELRAGLVDFVKTSKVEFGVGRAGFGVPFVGCGAGLGFFSSVEVPFVGGLLSTVARNVLAADSQLTGGALRHFGDASSRLIPGVKAGTGCGIGVGYGYGAGIWLSPGVWKPSASSQTDERGTQGEWGGVDGASSALSERLGRVEQRLRILEERADQHGVVAK